MAKNFPFFKFIATEWLTGDIVYEDFSTQGLFINICALYWQRDGVLTIEDVKKRYKTDIIDNLINRFITVSNDGFINIEFLDEQLIEANHISKVNSENGKKGAIAKRNKATAKRPLSDTQAKLSKEEKEQEKEIKENNIDARKLKFSYTLKPYLEKYGKELLNDFYKYWSEPNKSNTKFKAELEKTWSLERRIETWVKNESIFNKNKPTEKPTSVTISNINN